MQTIIPISLKTRAGVFSKANENRGLRASWLLEYRRGSGIFTALFQVFRPIVILVAESAEMMGKCQPDVLLVVVVMPCGRAGCVKPNGVSGKERLGTRLALRLYDLNV